MRLSSSAGRLARITTPHMTFRSAVSTAASLKRKPSTSVDAPVRARRLDFIDDFGFNSPSDAPSSSTKRTAPPPFRLRDQLARKEPQHHQQLRVHPSRSLNPKKPKTATLLDGPIYDSNYIEATYQPPSGSFPEPRLRTATKDAFQNYCTKHDADPTFATVFALVEGKQLFRSTITMDGVVGIGDAHRDKESQRLAMLSVLLQLHISGQLYAPPAPANSVTLSDGSTTTLEAAQLFLEFYCRRFGFAEPVVKVDRRDQGDAWDSYMFIEGRKIGLGTASSKKSSTNKCILDTVQYLERNDPPLWQDYLQKARTGDTLGDSPPITLFVPRKVRDDVRDLCADLHHSKIYNSNASRILTAHSQTLVERIPVSHVDLAQKSQYLFKAREAYAEDLQYLTMRRQRKVLPVNQCLRDIVSLIEQNDVTIFMASTGSGKSTQIPQIILDSFIEQGRGGYCNILCTQPRRLAALGVASRVAAERGEPIGRSVGYNVRFDCRPPQNHGSITFCTVGVCLKLLQTAFNDPTAASSLDDVTHILVDEVHERDVDTDLLLVVLKRYMADRRARGVPLKVVLMSATIDPTLFQNYFPDQANLPAPVLDIPGRSFPVDKLFLDDYLSRIESSKDAWVLKDPIVQKFLLNERPYSSLATAASITAEDIDIPFPLIAATISRVVQDSDEGHVLVFLPGWEEIQKVDRLLKEGRWAVEFKSSNIEIHMLHSNVPLSQQQAVFTAPRRGVRRIILTTNIAETSVTIPDVVYVVDSGRLKENRYDPERHLTSLVTAWIGQSNLNQRAGRAGRHRKGFYYGIMTRGHSEALSTHQTVEMARTDLTNVVMHIKAMNFSHMGVYDVLNAAIEPPVESRIDAAMKHLSVVGALDEKERLTALGRILLQLPVDVHLGRLILYGAFFRCLDQAISLAAILSSRDPWLAPMGQRKEAQQVKDSWSPRHFRSDPLASLRAYNAWASLMQSGRQSDASHFLHTNYLSGLSMQNIYKVRNQLLQSLGQAGLLGDAVILSDMANADARAAERKQYVIPLDLKSNSESYAALLALISIAAQPKFAVPTGPISLRTRQDKKAVIHPSSINSSIGKPVKHSAGGALVAFMEKRNSVSDSTSQTFLANTSYVTPLTYILFGSHKQEVATNILRCDGWLIFNTGTDVRDVLRLRHYIDRSLLRFFSALALGERKQTFYSERETDDDIPEAIQPLSVEEKKELAFLSKDIVRILDVYSQERIDFFDSIKQIR